MKSIKLIIIDNSYIKRYVKSKPLIKTRDNALKQVLIKPETNIFLLKILRILYPAHMWWGTRKKKRAKKKWGRRKTRAGRKSGRKTKNFTPPLGPARTPRVPLFPLTRTHACVYYTVAILILALSLSPF